MKRIVVTVLSCLLLTTALLAEGIAEDAAMLAPVTEKERCHVCGMFVGKYPAWVSQLQLSDDRVVMFDGPKDMLVYYFEPDEYGAAGGKVVDIVVKDYYSQQWIDGRKALYVTGSDVYGPMGEEFVPFDSRKAAENFMEDHHGKRILAFDEITPDLVRSMRKGHKMKGHMKK